MAPHDYRFTSSVTQMLWKLCWRRLDQRRIDTRLIMLVAITLTISNQIAGSPNSSTIWHTDKSAPLSITASIAFPKNCHAPHRGTDQSCCLPGDARVSLITRFCFYLLNYTFTLLSLRYCTNPFHPLHLSFTSAYPL